MVSISATMLENFGKLYAFSEGTLWLDHFQAYQMRYFCRIQASVSHFL